MRALEIWHRLDFLGRGIDGFSGFPIPIRLEAINSECERYADSEGLRWRVIMLEEIVYRSRIEKYKADRDKEESKRKSGR